jgi:hypothetical protein
MVRYIHLDMSYTTYAYSNLQITPAVQDRTGTIQASLDVQNTGTRKRLDSKKRFLFATREAGRFPTFRSAATHSLNCSRPLLTGRPV